MKSSDLLFWIWFAQALGAGNKDFRHLIGLYETPYEVFCAESAELERVESLSERTVIALSDKSLDEASRILDMCERFGIGIMTYTSPLYPQALREIKNPPVLLYYAGTVPRFAQCLSIGMVGTRRMSAYGMETAYKISYELSAANVIIVSGLAEGIDGVASAAALRAGGTTVAVLGCGLDIVYPKHHGLLMKRVAEQGLLLSEYPPGTKPVSFHFPTRNRIISGLSHGVVVVEAGIGSGSLITAKEAVVQGRDVFAIPANADGIGADGANGLLRDGAVFAMDASDIVARYRYLFLDTLFAEQVAQASAHSAPDLAYLREIGVLKTEKAACEGEGFRSTEKANALDGKREAPERGRYAKQSKKVKKEEPAPARTVAPSPSETADAVLQSLTPLQLAILKSIPDDASVTADELSELGDSYGEVITALTMLEIMGLVRKLPGSLYTKV